VEAGQANIGVLRADYPALGELVEANPDLVEVRSLAGETIPKERLGLGIVEEVAEDGWILVRWTEAETSAWMAFEDVRSLGSDACLVTVVKCDSMGNARSTKQKVVTTAGLNHHWTVQILPRGVLRTIRADGLAWTFDWNPIFRQVNTRGTMGFLPPDDDDAEAVTVAEIAVK
jgi:hypothetical protein